MTWSLGRLECPALALFYSPVATPQGMVHPGDKSWSRGISGKAVPWPTTERDLD